MYSSVDEQWSVSLEIDTVELTCTVYYFAFPVAMLSC